MIKIFLIFCILLSSSLCLVQASEKVLAKEQGITFVKPAAGDQNYQKNLSAGKTAKIELYKSSEWYYRTRIKLFFGVFGLGTLTGGGLIATTVLAVLFVSYRYAQEIGNEGINAHPVSWGMFIGLLVSSTLTAGFMAGLFVVIGFLVLYTGYIKKLRRFSKAALETGDNYIALCIKL